ncbi:MAG: hypothetical protein SFZ03_10880 [Candidatus Melainabacteria bacterium]|nr:hypothetical protein [Candidatus Melainabacteria bacterium]
MKSPQSSRLAYLLIISPMPNVYVGGAMVTDSRGLPVEFRYTEPIQPSKIQQILYGKVLPQYIKREVIQETLIKSLETQFQLLLVQDDLLLDYPAKGYSILRISETKAAPLGVAGSFQDLSEAECLLQTSAESSPVRVQQALVRNPVAGSKTAEPHTEAANAAAVAEKQPEEVLAGGRSALVEKAWLLVELGSAMDVYEPMGRVERALETICKESGLLQPTPART